MTSVSDQVLTIDNQNIYFYITCAHKILSIQLLRHLTAVGLAQSVERLNAEREVAGSISRTEQV